MFLKICKFIVIIWAISGIARHHEATSSKPGETCIDKYRAGTLPKNATIYKYLKELEDCYPRLKAAWVDNWNLTMIQTMKEVRYDTNVVNITTFDNFIYQINSKPNETEFALRLELDKGNGLYWKFFRKLAKTYSDMSDLFVEDGIKVTENETHEFYTGPLLNPEFARKHSMYNGTNKTVIKSAEQAWTDIAFETFGILHPSRVDLTLYKPDPDRKVGNGNKTRMVLPDGWQHQYALIFSFNLHDKTFGTPAECEDAVLTRYYNEINCKQFCFPNGTKINDTIINANGTKNGTM